MNKRGQLSMLPSDFSQSSPTPEFQKPNMLKRIAMGLVAAVFLFIISPIVVSISEALMGDVCVNVTTCLFYKFIVPAFILGGIFGVVKYVWSGD
jgi:uncharacterized membrane protein YqgA involved in biofilm formation